MAGRLTTLRQLAQKVVLSKAPKGFTSSQIRTFRELPPTDTGIVLNGYGAINPKPVTVSFASVRVFVTVFPFLYMGATMSKMGAAWLEENDIFVPEEDDD